MERTVGHNSRLVMEIVREKAMKVDDNERVRDVAKYIEKSLQNDDGDLPWNWREFC